MPANYYKDHRQIHHMNLKIHYSFKLGGMAKMARLPIKREILAALMENPLYFKIPLRKRLEFLKLFSEQSIPQRICEGDEHLTNGKSYSRNGL
jgi:hypothetical protein